MDNIKVFDIHWDYSRDDVRDMLDRLGISETCKKFHLNPKFVPKDDGVVIDFCIEQLHHGRATVYKAFDLPESIEVPASWSDEDISNYLSDKYGYYHNGFSRSDDEEVNEVPLRSTI